MLNPNPAPTQDELDQYIGRKGSFLLGEMRVMVKIKKAKISYNHVRLLCEPMGGGIAAWKNLEKLTLDGMINHNQKDK